VVVEVVLMVVLALRVAREMVFLEDQAVVHLIVVQKEMETLHQ
jgi:hypothetical protein